MAIAFVVMALRLGLPMLLRVAMWPPVPVRMDAAAVTMEGACEWLVGGRVQEGRM